MSVQVKTDLPQDSSPILAEVVRGGMVESRHHASVAVVDAHGGIVRAWGDVELPIYGRSAIKPLLAIPLVESGRGRPLQARRRRRSRSPPPRTMPSRAMSRR